MDLSHCYCLVAVCLAFTGSSSGLGLLPDLLNGTVGRSVMFATTQSPPEAPFLSVGWVLHLDNGTKISIITSTVNSDDVITPSYGGRINITRSTGSLELSHLTLDDSGKYSLTIFPQTGHVITGECRLHVHEPVSNVTLTPSTTDLLELISSVSLSCHVSSGTSLSYRWMNGSSEVNASSVGVQISNGGAVLTVLNVTRYDQGPYRCRVSNPASNETSDPLTLYPSFGPENIRITGPAEIENGLMLKLHCSVESSPTAHFTWINGTEIISRGAEFSKTVTLSDSGNFTCRAANDVTNFTVSAVHRLSVTEIITTNSLSAGAIAGIAIAVIVVVVLVGGLLYRVYAGRTSKKLNVKMAATNGGFVRDSALSSQDMYYANINHFRKNDDVGGTLPSADSSTIYSDTRRPAA